MNSKSDSKVRYKGYMPFDNSIVYAPYSTGYISTQDAKIKQEGLSFTFCVTAFKPALDWVLSERDVCRVEWLDNYQYMVKITFSTMPGAVEFKLRFM